MGGNIHAEYAMRIANWKREMDDWKRKELFRRAQQKQNDSRIPSSISYDRIKTERKQMPDYGFPSAAEVKNKTPGKSPWQNPLNRTMPNLNIKTDPEPPRPARRKTPPRYYINTCCVKFSSGGILVKIPSKRQNRGSTHKIQLLKFNFSKRIDPVVGDLLEKYPGPFSIFSPRQVPKQQVVRFCEWRSEMVDSDYDVIDKFSKKLLWRLLALMIRQNGQVLGTDIAELLLEGYDDGTSETESFSMVQDPMIDSEKGMLSKFRDLMLYGRQQEALEFAVQNKLWGHALFLASKMGDVISNNVMVRFYNDLTMSDPLQTAYQFLSGNVPSAVHSVAEWISPEIDDAVENKSWKSWRPHVAMMISNSMNLRSDDYQRERSASIAEETQKSHENHALIETGNSLLNVSMKQAADLCYLIAGVEPSTLMMDGSRPKDSKIILLGQDHSTFNIFTENISFKRFANVESIMLTEIWEYATSLSKPSEQTHFKSIIIFKLLLALELYERNSFQKSQKYLEIITDQLLKIPEEDLISHRRLIMASSQLGYALRSEIEAQIAVSKTILTSQDASKQKKFSFLTKLDDLEKRVLNNEFVIKRDPERSPIPVDDSVFDTNKRNSVTSVNESLVSPKQTPRNSISSPPNQVQNYFKPPEPRSQTSSVSSLKSPVESNFTPNLPSLQEVKKPVTFTQPFIPQNSQLVQKASFEKPKSPNIQNKVAFSPVSTATRVEPSIRTPTSTNKNVASSPVVSAGPSLESSMNNMSIAQTRKNSISKQEPPKSSVGFGFTPAAGGDYDYYDHFSQQTPGNITLPGEAPPAQTSPSPPTGRRSRNTSVSRSRNNSANFSTQNNPPNLSNSQSFTAQPPIVEQPIQQQQQQQQQPQTKPTPPATKAPENSESKSWFPSLNPFKRKEVHYGEKLSMVYDEKLKRYIDPNAPPEEETVAPPPPMMGGFQPQPSGAVPTSAPSNGPTTAAPISQSQSIPNGPPRGGGNQFRRGNLRRGGAKKFGTGPSSGLPPTGPPPDQSMR